MDSTPTTDNATDKRKPDDDDNEDTPTTTPQIPQPIQKRQRTTLIDDPTAITFLQELGLSQQFFDDGKVLAWGLQPDDPDFLRIQKYVERGQDKKYGIKIQSILRIIPSVQTLLQDPNAYLDFKDDPKAEGMKRMMLWHGTKGHYVKSILENGLRLPNYGGCYGFGIYFADMACKSCGFTDYHYRDEGKVGYLFLNDVLLGNICKACHMDRTLLKPPPMDVTPWWKIIGEKRFVTCQGVMSDFGYGPSPFGDVNVDGCTWPLGYTKGSGFGLNEYIIYDTKQVKPKFLVKFEYTKKPFYHKIA